MTSPIRLHASLRTSFLLFLLIGSLGLSANARADDDMPTAPGRVSPFVPVANPTAPTAPVSVMGNRFIWMAPSDTNQTPAFELWLPKIDESQKVAAILVFPGSGSPGGFGGSMGMSFGGSSWLNFAAEHHIALLRASFPNPQGLGSRPYWRADLGSADTLFRALDELARASNRQEIAHVPLLFYGSTEAAQFSYHFAQLKSARTLAFVVDGNPQQGSYRPPAPSEAARQVPGLFFLADIVPPNASGKIARMTPEQIKTLDGGGRIVPNEWADGRSQGALWCRAKADRDKENVARHFFEAILANSGTPEGGYTIPYTPSADGGREWLGDPATGTIAPLKDKDDLSLSWLPTEEFAKVWQIAMTPPEGGDPVPRGAGSETKPNFDPGMGR